MQKLAYSSGALLGLLGVISGAMGAHALKDVVDPDLMGSYETAVRFQMYHALLLLLLGSLLHTKQAVNLLRYAIWSILIGVVLFSGSIYLLVLSPLKVGLITPLGGLIMIIGWGCLLMWALRQAKS